MNYDFYLVTPTDPRLGDFERACTLLENKCKVAPAPGSEHLILTLGEEQLALLSEPCAIEPEELLRIYGDSVADQLQGTAWVSEVNCPLDKDIAEAARTILMLVVSGTRGLVIDPQSNEILNALDA